MTSCEIFNAAISMGPFEDNRQKLHDRFEGEFLPLFHGRTLAFDEPATTAYATLRVQARAQGFGHR